MSADDHVRTWAPNGLFWSGNFVVARATHAAIPPLALSFGRWAIALAIVLGVEQIRELGFHLFIIIVPRTRPFGTPLPVIFTRVDFNPVPRPEAETSRQPIFGRFRTIRLNSLAQNRRARLALLGSKLVEPFDVVFRKVGKDAGHDDILISYHDIMSISNFDPGADASGVSPHAAHI